VGIGVGIFAFQLTKIENEIPGHYRVEENNVGNKTLDRGKKKIRTGFFFLWCVLLALFFQAEFSIGKQILPAGVLLQIITRSLLIMLTWYFIISPILLIAARKWLETVKKKRAEDLQAVAELFPSMQQMIYKSWELSAPQKGFRRIRTCCKIILMNTLRPHA
jgi:hypothetical protein